ncbi:hypothetical protein B0O80DRAFT_202893 [Mortierella sp. GBAus27b]|nr:hypothetical protein B0O80DRAFT_202893 [Mortierella sp. GBAus27b]
MNCSPCHLSKSAPHLSILHLSPSLPASHIPHPTTTTQANRLSSQDLTNTMSDYKYTFEVTMTCGGCSNAVRKALEKNSEVITRFDIDQEKDTVRVDSELSRVSFKRMSDNDEVILVVAGHCFVNRVVVHLYLNVGGCQGDSCKDRKGSRSCPRMSIGHNMARNFQFPVTRSSSPRR